jgi:tetratricopeptide (TPR) repeat protein
MHINKLNPAYFVIVTALLGACAAPVKTQEPVKVTLESVVTEANTAQAAGQTDQALNLFKDATNKFPTDKTPWLRIAQIKFDSASYGEAISNALEALQRDPTDKIANSIVTVSGLRLATKALADLRTQNALSGTVKNEAQDLAKLLRDNLGETVLVPSTAITAPRVRASAPLAARPVAPASRPTSTSSKSDAPDSGKSNPFGGLK